MWSNGGCGLDLFPSSFKRRIYALDLSSEGPELLGIDIDLHATHGKLPEKRSNKLLFSVLGGEENSLA